MDLLLDPPADFGIDALPVPEGTLENLAAYPAEQAAGDLVDQLGPLVVVEHLAHHVARLREVVVVLPQRVGVAHHLAVGFPAVLDRAGLVRPAAAAAVGRVDRRAAAVIVGHLAVEHVGVDRRSEEHTSELQSLMRTSYAVFCLKKKKK